MKGTISIAVSCALLLSAIGRATLAQEFANPSDLGTTGLIDMPSARMQPDATLSTSYARQDVTDTYSMTYLAMPWLESTFRYAIMDPRVDFNEARDNSRDRSYEIKIRLLEESALMPQLALGIRDLVGTGNYGGEYLVGSKRFGDFDFTLGVGWGRFSGRSIAGNPLKRIDDRFARRSSETGRGGKARTADFFRGEDIGLFGGIEYRPHGGPLSFVAEYNSDTYQRETSRGTLDLESPISVGINWQVTPGMQLGANWQHGSQLGFTVSFQLDTASIVPRARAAFPWYSYVEKAGRLAEDAEDSWFYRMRLDSIGGGYFLVSGSIEDGDHALIEYHNVTHLLSADAAREVMISAAVHLPEEVSRVTLVLNEAGMYPMRISYLRSAMDNREFQRSNPEEALSHIDFLPSYSIEDPQHQLDPSPAVLHLKLGILPGFHIFDPENPLMYQIAIGGLASMNLPRGWGLSARYRLDLFNTFDRIWRQSESVLPHVRSDLREYLQQGSSRIDHLFVQKFGNFGRDIYYHAFGGILEWMYMGTGMEVLYFPFRSPFAVGVNLIGVKQREFAGGFGARDYDTVTGHLSIYWATPFYHFDAAIHYGRYLARDRGATIELNRSFPSGWAVGVFASFTNVSAEDFGEGSFDKGFKINIPLDVLSSENSRRNNNLLIRPIQRDGGQRLDGYGTNLWRILRSSHYDFMTKSKNRLLNP